MRKNGEEVRRRERGKKETDGLDFLRKIETTEEHRRLIIEKMLLCIERELTEKEEKSLAMVDCKRGEEGARKKE